MAMNLVVLYYRPFILYLVLDDIVHTSLSRFNSSAYSSSCLRNFPPGPSLAFVWISRFQSRHRSSSAGTCTGEHLDSDFSYSMGRLVSALTSPWSFAGSTGVLAGSPFPQHPGPFMDELLGYWLYFCWATASAVAPVPCQIRCSTLVSCQAAEPDFTVFKITLKITASSPL